MVGEGTVAAADRVEAEVVVLAVPYTEAPHVVRQHAGQLRGTVIVDPTNPVDFSILEPLDRDWIGPFGSGAQLIAAEAPDGAAFVKAFNTNFAGPLLAGEVGGQPLDVFVAGDDDNAKRKVMQLIHDGGMRALDAGRLARARELEATALLHMEIQGLLMLATPRRSRSSPNLSRALAMSRIAPCGALARGAAAGAIGTALMTAAQTLAMKARRSDRDEDAGAGTGPSAGQQDPWEQAPAPAKVARKILEGVFNREVPSEKIGLLTNAVHWGYGTSCGALYGLLPGAPRPSPVRRGLMFGTAVWVMSYLTLVPMGIYQAPWRYPPGELALDLSYHLAYGAGVGAGFALIDC